MIVRPGGFSGERDIETIDHNLIDMFIQKVIKKIAVYLNA